MSNPNDKRIAKNTMYLYGRMMLTIFVSLYSSRIVLNALGVADYGIYNVVGGIVMLLAFLNGTMSGATSRFMSYALGRGDSDELKATFSAALTVHVGIAVLLLILAETVGLWYVNTRLVIAPERMWAANWTYQMSILASVCTVLQIPYLAAIMAHERMGYYALVALSNSFLKLGIVLIILFFPSTDNLIFYSTLVLAVSLIISAMYIIFSRHRFTECHWQYPRDKTIMKDMLKFCSWDSYGNLCFTARAQGTLVILNRFGGTVLNAAGGLCATVAGTVNSFAGSIITAFRPQIIQQYAKGDIAYMLTLLNNCARYSMLLLGLLIIPLIIGMDSILRIWLIDPPAYTTAFCRIALIAVCGELMHTVIAIGIHATGNVTRISFISGSMFLLELPLMWWLLTFTGNPPVVYTVHLAMIVLIVMADSWILKVQLPQFRIISFWWRGILLPVILMAASFAITYFIVAERTSTIWQLIVMALISSAVLAALTWIFAIDGTMRKKLYKSLRERVIR